MVFAVNVGISAVVWIVLLRVLVATIICLGLTTNLFRVGSIVYVLFLLIFIGI